MNFCDLLPSESLVRLAFQRLNVLVPSKLNGFLSWSAKIECKSQVKILNVKKLNAIFSWVCQLNVKTECKN